MRYVSLFSGVEAASVAWEGLGWEPLCFAEIDAFPSAVLAYRFPPSHIPMEGDSLFFGNPMTGVNCTCGEWRADDGKHRWRPPKEAIE